LSTILDALRKAQEETGDKRQPPVGEHPAATEAVTPPPARRRFGWPAAVAGILALAFAGGLAFGDRIAALLGSGADEATPPADVQVAAHTDAAPSEPAAPNVKQKSDERPAAPAMRRGKGPKQGQAAAVNEPVAQAPVQGAAPDAAAPAVAPSPYGQLHVFGAGERPAGNKPSNEDRLARLQQLRDKMLKARQDAAARGPQAEAPAAPAQIFVPPSRDAAPAQAAAPKSDAPHLPASAGAVRDAGEPANTAPPTEPAHDAPVEVARADVPPPADAPSRRPEVAAPADAPSERSDAAVPTDPAVGVSVTNAHVEAAEAEVQDPDIPPAHDARAAAVPETPTTVAAIAPQPAPGGAARAAAAPASQQVLRRAPGGAPQVAINILQWSAEPGRRFAFVSVDGGNMTQVREGDHIGGLTIKHIHQQMIEFGFNDSTFLLRAN
jgi:hypothetical protein